MKYFLSDERRQSLHKSLTDLGMPTNMAGFFTSFSDDIPAIDLHMTAITSQSADLAQQLTASEDEEEVKTLSAFILADIAILVTYKAEASDRELDGTSFPSWLAATRQSDQQVSGLKDKLHKTVN